MRFVLDTNVLVAALRSDRGASRRLLLSALDREIQVIASVPLMIEYEAVLTRQHQLVASGLSIGETNALQDALAAVAEPAQLHFLWRPRLRDPADEVVLARCEEVMSRYSCSRRCSMRPGGSQKAKG